MPTIRMRETRDGANDGHTVRPYLKGLTYVVGDGLAASFVSAAVADLVGEPDPAKPSPEPPRRGRRKPAAKG